MIQNDTISKVGTYHPVTSQLTDPAVEIGVHPGKWRSRLDHSVKGILDVERFLDPSWAGSDPAQNLVR
jgi:hypothetical protein